MSDSSKETTDQIEILDGLFELDTAFDERFGDNKLEKLPFGDILRSIKEIELKREDPRDFNKHMSYVIEGVAKLLSKNPEEILYSPEPISTEDKNKFTNHLIYFKKLISGDKDPAYNRILKLATLYHDIGVSIRRDRHSIEGVHIVRDLYEGERGKLKKLICHDIDPTRSEELFRMFWNIVGYHELFGVLSTGESSSPIFVETVKENSGEKDIEYFKIFLSILAMINIADANARMRERKEKPVLSWRNNENPEFSWINNENEKGTLRKFFEDKFGIENSWITETDTETIMEGYTISFKKEGKNPIKLTIDEMGREVTIEIDTNKYEKLLLAKEKGNKIDIYSRLSQEQTNGIGYELGDTIIDDWEKLTKKFKEAKGEKRKFAKLLVEEEEKSVNAITRIHRIIKETTPPEHKDECQIHQENINLASAVGGVSVNEFCELFAHISRLDYFLRFFSLFRKTAINEKTVGPDKVCTTLIELLDRIASGYRDLIKSSLIGVEFEHVTEGVSKHVISLLLGETPDKGRQWMVDDETTIWVIYRL